MAAQQRRCGIPRASVLLAGGCGTVFGFDRAATKAHVPPGASTSA
jgi:hypothetical protein